MRGQRQGGAGTRRWRSLGGAVKALIVTTALAVAAAAAVLYPNPAQALTNGSGTMQSEGFDSCSLPTTTAMHSFYTGTPLWWYNVYIGGQNFACAPPTVTSSWLNTVNAQGWSYLFTWVGLQPPCTTFNHRFSSNTSTAFTQGQDDAVSAVLALRGLGVTNDAQGSPVVYDLEQSPASCQAATNSYVRGWVTYMHSCCPTQLAGVYGSVCGSNLGALAGITPVPDFIWGAYYDGTPSTKDLFAGGCGVPNGDWISHQRFKQYQGTHNQTYNGVTLSIDSDCADGPTDPAGNDNTESQCIS